MKDFDFLNFTTNTQIANALLLIVILLTYIAWRLTENRKKSPSKR